MGPDDGVHRLAACGKQGRKKFGRLREDALASCRRRIKVAGAVVRLDSDHAPAGRRHTRELRHHLLHVVDVLEHGDAESGIEDGLLEREKTGVGSGKPDALIVGRGLMTRHHDALDHQINADETNLGEVQASDMDFGQALAAADVEDPVAGARAQRFDEELGELVVPPPLAQVLESG